MIREYQKEKGAYKYLIIFHDLPFSNYMLWNHKNNSYLILFALFIPYKIIKLPLSKIISNRMQPSTKNASTMVHTTRSLIENTLVEHYKIYNDCYYWHSFYSRSLHISFKRNGYMYTRNLLLSMNTLFSTLFGHKFNKYIASVPSPGLIFNKISIIRHRV